MGTTSCVVSKDFGPKTISNIINHGPCCFCYYWIVPSLTISQWIGQIIQQLSCLLRELMVWDGQPRRLSSIQSRDVPLARREKPAAAIFWCWLRCETWRSKFFTMHFLGPCLGSYFDEFLDIGKNNNAPRKVFFFMNQGVAEGWWATKETWSLHCAERHSGQGAGGERCSDWSFWGSDSSHGGWSERHPLHRNDLGGRSGDRMKGDPKRFGEPHFHTFSLLLESWIFEHASAWRLLVIKRTWIGQPGFKGVAVA